MTTEEGQPGQQQETDTGTVSSASFHGAAWTWSTLWWALSTGVEGKRNPINRVNALDHWSGVSDNSGSHLGL